MEQPKLNNAREEFERKLNESKANYIHSLPGKISEIKLIWNQLGQNNWRKEILLKIKTLAHNLAGSGGTFGFQELSDQAKVLEQALADLTDSSDIVEKANITAKVDELLIVLQQVELSTIQDAPVVPTILNKSDVIYILDADKESAIGMSRQLMYYGCTVKVLNDSSKLEATLRTARPLLILIDDKFANQMLDKYSVVQTLSKNWMIDCPIVYISNHDDFESRINAIKNGASAFFTKPLDVSLLIERIHILTNAGVVEPYRILLVEDDKELADYYALIMRKGGMTVFVENQPELALSRIMELNPELVVMDLYMPNYNGIDLIKVIRQHQSLYTLPIVLLTAEKDIDMQFLAREVGVDDFLQKPITESHLYDSVLNRVQRSRYMNISMAKDSLTGLFVHKKINEFLEFQLIISERYHRCLSYVMIDIDNFKQINDTYGHLAGDDVLVTLSNFLKTSVRATDFVGRYGGEEFVIIAPETDGKSIFETVDRLRKEFSTLKHYSENRAFSVTFSAGISSFPKYKSLDIIMAVADKALYLSKENGRNQVTLA